MWAPTSTVLALEIQQLQSLFTSDVSIETIDSLVTEFAKRAQEHLEVDDYTHIFYLLQSLSLRTQSIAKDTAYEVGAILEITDKTTWEIRIYTWYSRELDLDHHAEKTVIQKALDAGETRETIKWSRLYSSLEPCTERNTKTETPCTNIAIDYEVGEVIIAEMEDATFQDCKWRELLEAEWITLKHYPIVPSGFHSRGKNIHKH